MANIGPTGLLPPVDGASDCSHRFETGRNKRSENVPLGEEVISSTSLGDSRQHTLIIMPTVSSYCVCDLAQINQSAS